MVIDSRGIAFARLLGRLALLRLVRGLDLITTMATMLGSRLDLNGRSRLKTWRPGSLWSPALAWGCGRVRAQTETARALRHHRETQLLERGMAGPAYADLDLVFADELGAPVHPQRLTEWFGKLRKAAGIPTGSLHVLRHTSATLALTATPTAACCGWAPRRRS